MSSDIMIPPCYCVKQCSPFCDQWQPTGGKPRKYDPDDPADPFDKFKDHVRWVEMQDDR